MSEYYNSEEELEAIVRGFESGTTPATDFPHRAHLVVVTWYLNNSTPAEALLKMRASILNFLDHYGIKGKYNETITLFWIIIVERFLRTSVAELSLLERTNAVVKELSNSSLMFEYYSKEMLWSEQAMREWVKPDLKSLE